jgi:5-formyltetrahydrofolate cyclo-ligase
MTDDIVPQNATADTKALKNALRRVLLAQRQTLSAAQRQHRQAQGVEAMVNALLNQFAGACVAVYQPHAGEPDVLGVLADQGLSAACSFALPIVQGKGLPLQFARWASGEALVRGAYGINVPAQIVLVRPDIIVLPCVGYSVAGNTGKTYRLGYGGGYYDRSLAALNTGGGAASTIAMGVAWREAACVISPERFDMPMDRVFLL